MVSSVWPVLTQSPSLTCSAFTPSRLSSRLVSISNTWGSQHASARRVYAERCNQAHT